MGAEREFQSLPDDMFAYPEATLVTIEPLGPQDIPVPMVDVVIKTGTNVMIRLHLPRYFADHFTPGDTVSLNYQPDALEQAKHPYVGCTVQRGQAVIQKFQLPPGFVAITEPDQSEDAANGHH